MNASNIKMIQSIAIDFVYMDIVLTEFSPAIIQHPYFPCGIVYINGGYHDMTKEPDVLKQRQDMIVEHILKTNTVSSILHFIHKSYRLIAYKYMHDYMSEDDKAKALMIAYTTSENPNCDVDVDKSELLEFFENVDVKQVLSKDDIQVYDKLSDEVIIYRGGHDAEALSWTIDYNIADWFSKRFRKTNLYKAKINKNDIFAYINDRNEKEVIVNYNKIYDIESEDFTHGFRKKSD